MKITIDKTLEILQLALAHKTSLSQEDLDSAITLALEALLERRKRLTHRTDGPYILLPHETWE